MIPYEGPPIKIKKIIDLTHNLNDRIPTWTGGCGFSAKVTGNYDPAFVMEYHFPLSSAGTHMDAPVHFSKGGATIENIPLVSLIVPLHVIDVREISHPDFFLLPEHIEDYEKNYSPIQPNSLVVLYSGWQEKWSDKEKYRGKAKDGSWHYPGFSLESAEMLLKKKIAGIGIDTLNPDGNDPQYPVHYAILGAGKYIVENLRNLDKVPPNGAYAAILPIKIEGGPEAPVRAVAFTIGSI